MIDGLGLTGWPGSTAANGVDNFDPVAGAQRLVGMARTRHDVAVELDRDPFVRQLLLLQQLGNAQFLCQFAGTAVQDNLHELTTGLHEERPRWRRPGKGWHHTSVTGALVAPRLSDCFTMARRTRRHDCRQIADMAEFSAGGTARALTLQLVLPQLVLFVTRPERNVGKHRRIRMSDQIKPSAANTPDVTPENPAPARRRLLQGALAATPVLLAVASKPVLAGQLCAPSGFASGNVSTSDQPTACNGWTPGYWKAKPGVQWPAPFTPGQKFHSVFVGSYFGTKTLKDVVGIAGGGLNMLGRHCVAGILNASAAPLGYLLTVEEIKKIWAQCIATAPNSVYVTGTGITMTLSDLDDFFTATYHQNVLAYYN